MILLGSEKDTTVSLSKNLIVPVRRMTYLDSLCAYRDINEIAFISLHYLFLAVQFWRLIFLESQSRNSTL
jgi:hypothetical protein